MPSFPAIHVPREPELFSTRIGRSSCGRCSTAPRRSLAGTVASGPCRWQHRLPSTKDSSKGLSRGRPSGLLWRAFFECVGSERNAGSAPQILCTKEKRRRDRLMEVATADSEWAVGFEEECWRSRLALPTLRAAGPKRESLCASFRSGSLKTIPIRKPSPATGSTSAGARSNVVAFRGWPAR
jgi:hypothetical protein